MGDLSLRPRSLVAIMGRSAGDARRRTPPAARAEDAPLGRPPLRLSTPGWSDEEDFRLAVASDGDLPSLALEMGRAGYEVRQRREQLLSAVAKEMSHGA